MQVVFSVGAALRSEKVKTAKRINQCASFVKLAIVGEDIENVTTHGNIVTFECSEFGVVEEHSSKDWQTLFPYRIDGRRVIINVPGKYVIGPPIPGYQGLIVRTKKKLKTLLIPKDEIKFFQRIPRTEFPKVNVSHPLNFL